MSTFIANPVNTPLTFNVTVTAAGSNQATATLITARISRITGGDGAGVRLPPGRPAGEVWTLINASAASPGVGGTSFVAVYPSSGETISPLSANSQCLVYAGNSLTIMSFGSGLWRVSDVGHLQSDSTTEMYAGSPTFYRGSSFYGGLSMFSTLTFQGASLAYAGSTGANALIFPDNLAEGFWIGEGTNRYLSFVSSNGTEQINASKNINLTGCQIASTIPTTLTTSGTTMTVDWNTGGVQVIDLQGASGNVTLTLSNPMVGGSYAIKFIQSSTARNVIWPGTVKWPGGIAPTISVANDAIDVVTLLWDGTIYMATYQQAYA